MHKALRERLESRDGELTIGELDDLWKQKRLSPLIRRCLVTIDHLREALMRAHQYRRRK